MDFETIVKKQEHIENLERCVKGLKLYFDHANIDVGRFVKVHGIKKYERLQWAMNFMFANFKDE